MHYHRPLSAVEWGPDRNQGWGGAGEGGGYLIPKDSEPFFECELEPVPACHSVPSPVVEVLMPHHTFNTSKVHVCCSLRGGQHQPAVEDVQRLVLHGSHVEVVHSHNVEQVQVVLKSKGVLHTQPFSFLYAAEHVSADYINQCAALIFQHTPSVFTLVVRVKPEGPLAHSKELNTHTIMETGIDKLYTKA